MTIDLAVLAGGSVAMAAVLKGYANGDLWKPAGSYVFSEFSGSSAAKFVEKVPGIGKYAKAFEYFTGKAASVATSVRLNCGE